MNRAERRRAARGGEPVPELVVGGMCDCPPVLVVLSCGRVCECDAVRVPEFDTLPEAAAS